MTDAGSEKTPRRPRRVVGQMEKSVRKDLRGLGKLDTGVLGSLAQSALILAQAIDTYSALVGSAAQLSALAKAIQELRTTLRSLVEVTGDGDGAGEPAADSTPVWDGPQPGPADAGAADRGGGGAPR